MHQSELLLLLGYVLGQQQSDFIVNIGTERERIEGHGRICTWQYSVYSTIRVLEINYFDTQQFLSTNFAFLQMKAELFRQRTDGHFIRTDKVQRL